MGTWSLDSHGPLSAPSGACLSAPTPACGQSLQLQRQSHTSCRSLGLGDGTCPVALQGPWGHLEGAGWGAGSRNGSPWRDVQSGPRGRTVVELSRTGRGLCGPRGLSGGEPFPRCRTHPHPTAHGAVMTRGRRPRGHSSVYSLPVVREPGPGSASRRVRSAVATSVWG